MIYFEQNMPLSTALIREAEKIIINMKVSELQKIIERLGLKRHGLKHELIDRVIYALRDSSYQKTVCSYLDEKRRNPMGQARSAPYSVPQRPYQTHPAQRGFMSNGYMGGSTMHSAQNMMPNRATPAPKELQIVPLPFYDVVAVLMPPMELASVPSGQKISSRQLFTYTLNEEHASLISYRYDAKSLPRHEIQLRFFNTTELKNPQKDDFPLNVNVRLNDLIVTLPNIIPTNKPNAEPKRPSRPVCITQISQKSGIQSYSNRLIIEWTGDKRSWAVAVYLVYRVNTDILFKRLFDVPSKHQHIEVTRCEIIKKLTGGDDDGIAMDQLKIGLLCPLVKTRMKYPARCLDCTHLQCFDLTSYLMMNEKRPVWNCPVCSGYAPYDRLIIDEYFKDVISKVDENTTEVELKPDGRYEILKPDDVFDLSDDDDDDLGIVKMNDVKPSISNQPSSSSSKPAKSLDDDIIVLSDSDDETPRSNKPKGPSPSSSNLPDSTTKSTPPPKNRNEIEIITLDDTPPRPAAKSQMPKKDFPPSSNSVPNLSEALASIRGDNTGTGTPNLYNNPNWRVNCTSASNNLIGRQMTNVINQMASYNYAAAQQPNMNMMGADASAALTNFPPFWSYTQQFMGTQHHPHNSNFSHPNGGSAK